MSTGREIRCYDYVNHPYERVSESLKSNALEIFRDATRVASSRARTVASELRVNIGGLEIGTEIAISVNRVEEFPAKGKTPPRTVLDLEWEAANKPHLFPFMKAELGVYRLSATETQLDFSGQYEPPLGLLGEAMNSVVGHRVAEATVHRFLGNVASHLREELTET